MADPFTGEIRFFGFTFPPQDWAYCTGTQMSIQQHSVLFAVIGTRFGGNGQTTFALPNLQGRVLAGVGTMPGYEPVGQTGGSSAVALTYTQSPAHQHTVMAAPLNATLGPQVVPAPAEGSYLTNTPNAFSFNTTDINPWTVTTGLNPTTLGTTLGGTNGAAMPHENRQPYLVLNACICLYGEFPMRP